MNANKTKDIRRRLSSERESLIKSINRNRIAAEEIKLESTEDEGDLATISHSKDILYNLHEDSHTRLRFVQEAIKAFDRGQYGECLVCGEDINQKRLEAMPWATKCLKCQEQTEADHTSSRMVLAGQESDDIGL